MDCIFNQYIPESTSTRIVIPPASKTFVNGLCKQYSEEYPEELQQIMSFLNFKEQMIQLNENLATIWPCDCFFYGIGYCCCLCTLGLSFFVPYQCVKDAEEVIKRAVKEITKYYLKCKGWKMKLVKQCSTSWLEIYEYQNQYRAISITY